MDAALMTGKNTSRNNSFAIVGTIQSAIGTDLHGVCAAEHGQLPHCPVPVVEVVLQTKKQVTVVRTCREDQWS